MAKSRGRFGERVGWLRKADHDEEMWPAESFGGVSDEQFWDDLSADKPLSTTARSATPDSDARARAAQPRPQSAAKPGKRLPAAPARPAPVPHATPAAPSAATAQASTAAFPAIAASSGASTAAFPAVAQPARSQGYANRGGTAAQPVMPASAAQPMAPQTALPSAPAQGYPLGSGPMPATGPGSYGAGAATGPMPAGSGQPSRRRRGAEDDPLTSDAYSLRSSSDGRSYRSARHATPPGGFEAQPQPARTAPGSYGDPYASGAYPAAGYPAASSYPAGGGYSPSGSGSGPYPTADMHGPAGRRDGYPAPSGNGYSSTDSYPDGPSYRGTHAASNGAQAPAPPYDERYATPARAYTAPSPDYQGQQYGSRDYGRSPYQSGRNAPRGGDRR